MARRSLRLKHIQGAFPEARTVYLNADISDIIMANLDWLSLTALGKANRAGREMAKEEVRARLKLLIRPFLPPGTFDIFFDMLAKTNSIIVGGVPLYLINIGNPLWRTDKLTDDPRRPQDKFDMNLLVPKNRWREVKEWFNQIGFEGFNSYFVAPGFYCVVSGFMSTSHPSTQYPDGTKRTITISTCNANVVDIALHAPWSCQTNIISSSTITSFFPSQHLRLRTLRNSVESRFLNFPATHWDTYCNQWMKKRPCGRSCPASKSIDMKYDTPAFFNWSGRPMEDVIYRWASTSDKPLKYRFRCYNGHCANYVSPLSFY